MKIAFLSFYSGVVSRGVETYVHELANRLVLFGHDVTVYQNGKEVQGANYKTINLNTPFSMAGKGTLGLFFNTIRSIEAVRRFTARTLLLMDTSTDVVVATNNRLQAILCRLWTKRYGPKLVIPGQGGPGLDEKIALWCFPDVFVPLSKYQRDWARKVNPFIKVSRVIHNGVNLEKFGTKVRPLVINLPKPIILCSAALWPFMKRQHLLIRAVARVKDASLLLAGDGEGRDQLNRLGKKLLGDRFLIRSFSYDQMPSVYAACDLFSFPTSTWESFGVVLVEAMASGLPVVTTNDPIRKEIVGDAGIFIDPTNIEVYAVALENALRLKWGKRPQNQAKKFDWDKIAKEHSKLFESLLVK